MKKVCTEVPIIIQRLDFSHSDLISEVISDYRTSGAETTRTLLERSKVAEPSKEPSNYQLCPSRPKNDS